MCSRPTFVRTTTGASSTLVASSRPPSAGLDDGRLRLRGGELGERGGGQHLELRRADGLGGGAHAAERRFEIGRLPFTWIRSRQPVDMRGRVRADRLPSRREQRLAHPRRRRLSVRTDDVDGPERVLRIAELARAAAAFARGRTPPARAKRLDPRDVVSHRGHRARAGSARASRARRRRRLRGAFATKRSFASIPSARAISLRSRSRSASSLPFACTRSGLTTAEKIRCSSPSSGDEHAAPPEHCGRLLDARRARSTSAAKRSSGSGHGATISRRLAGGQVRPDLLRHVRHHRVQ